MLASEEVTDNFEVTISNCASDYFDTRALTYMSFEQGNGDKCFDNSESGNTTFYLKDLNDLNIGFINSHEREAEMEANCQAPYIEIRSIDPNDARMPKTTCTGAYFADQNVGPSHATRNILIVVGLIIFFAILAVLYNKQKKDAMRPQYHQTEPNLLENSQHSQG